MVRAELGNGNRDHAISLIRRVQERYVPSPFTTLMPTHEIPYQTIPRIYRKPHLRHHARRRCLTVVVSFFRG